MKCYSNCAILIIMVAVPVCSAQPGSINLNKDSPETLIGRNSTELSIHGLRLGLTHDEAWAVLEKKNSLIGEKDRSNPSRIYVFDQKPEGTKGMALLYLIWAPGEKRMSQITVFQECRSGLSPSFRRLLTFEAVDNTSDFKKKFIGYANKSKTTLDLPDIGVKHVNYFYDEIGIQIVHKRSSEGEQVIFALVQPKP